MIEVKDMDLYRYLATALLAAGNAGLRRLVLDAARGILDATKQSVLLDVLSEAGEAEDVRAALAALQARRPQRSRR
jgi:hypothetical protein